MPADRVPLSSDEIEVACDLLWSIKRDGELSMTAGALWARLQPIRHGDIGGAAQTQLSATEAQAVIHAAEDVQRGLRLDEDEDALLRRLGSLVD